MHRAFHRSARISFVLLAGICAVAFVAVLFLMSGESPEKAASEFLSALAKQDSQKLAALSIIRDESQDQVRGDWEKVLPLTKNFVFYWEVKSVVTDKDSATVRLDVTKDPYNPSAYAEHYELTMVKTKDGWKVDVPQIARDMYPFLPR